MVSDRRPYCPSLSRLVWEDVSLSLSLSLSLPRSLAQTQKRSRTGLSLLFRISCFDTEETGGNKCPALRAIASTFPAWGKEPTGTAPLEIQPKGGELQLCFCALKGICGGPSWMESWALRSLAISTCLSWNHLKSLSAQFKFSVQMGGFLFPQSLCSS